MSHPVPQPPAPGQESVWDYPRPPRVEPTSQVLEIWFADTRIARTDGGWRVLETSHPPSYYLPQSSFLDGVLQPTAGRTWCEWKGWASYFDLVVGQGTAQRVARRAAWTYPAPTRGYDAVRDTVAVMPSAVDRCLVDGEVVTPQEGGFYGGWITSTVVGPFKGGPGTMGW